MISETREREARRYFLGEKTIVLDLAEQISVEATARVMALAQALEQVANGEPGIEEVQPTYTGVAVHFDPALVSPSYVSALMDKSLDFLGGEAARRTTRDSNAGAADGAPREVPVLYGGDAGPDLRESAQKLGLDAGELIRRHSEREYLVHMIGFTPGFPYLGTLDPSIRLPRLETPRKSVPAGSVGIAREQTGIYSIPAPGGWRIIGRTPLTLFAPERDKPFLFEPGMRVKFRPVTDEEFRRLEAEEINRAGRRAQASSLDNAVPALMVREPGFFSTIQDLGRRGFRKYGVPLSGAVDPLSLVCANLLVGNPPGAAGIEMTYSGAAFSALIDIAVAVTGAPAQVSIDGHPAAMETPLLLRRSSVLEIEGSLRGARTYLAVAGGIRTPVSLRSRSTYVRASLGGFCGRSLREGDVLEAGPHPAPPWMASKSPERRTPFPAAGEEVTVRVLPGPEPAISGEILQKLTSAPYRVSPSSDRMALQLDGPTLVSGKTDIISGAVVPGVIQVASDGLPMVLLADGQTTGGYWRIASVVSADLPVLGQVRPGTLLKFRVVDYEFALRCLRG